MTAALGIHVGERLLALHGIAIDVDSLGGLLVSEHEPVIAEIECHVGAGDAAAALVMLLRPRQKPQADIVLRTSLSPEGRPLLGEHMNASTAADERDRLGSGCLGHLNQPRQPPLNVVIDLELIFKNNRLLGGCDRLCRLMR